MPTQPSDYRAACAALLEHAAYCRRSMARGLMHRSIAIPAIRGALSMARKVNISAHILGQV